MPVHSLYLSKLSGDQRNDLKRRLLERQSGVCFICEKSIDLVLQRDGLEIDHIIPIASDGKDEENNFALTHDLVADLERGLSEARRRHRRKK